MSNTTEESGEQGPTKTGEFSMAESPQSVSASQNTADRPVNYLSQQDRPTEANADTPLESQWNQVYTPNSSTSNGLSGSDQNSDIPIKKRNGFHNHSEVLDSLPSVQEDLASMGTEELERILVIDEDTLQLVKENVLRNLYNSGSIDLETMNFYRRVLSWEGVQNMSVEDFSTIRNIISNAERSGAHFSEHLVEEASFMSQPMMQTWDEPPDNQEQYPLERHLQSLSQSLMERYNYLSSDIVELVDLINQLPDERARVSAGDESANEEGNDHYYVPPSVLESLRNFDPQHWANQFFQYNYSSEERENESDESQLPLIGAPFRISNTPFRFPSTYTNGVTGSHNGYQPSNAIGELFPDHNSSLTVNHNTTRGQADRNDVIPGISTISPCSLGHQTPRGGLTEQQSTSKPSSSSAAASNSKSTTSTSNSASKSQTSV